MPRTRSRFPRLVAVAVAACAILAAIPTLAAAATTFTVDTTADIAPTPTACVGLPADCSLRQAIALANETAGLDTIVLPAGHYTLTLKGEDNESLAGDLDVEEESEVTIQGAGTRATIIDAAGLENRVFELLPLSSLSLSRLTVANGLAIDQYGGGIYTEEAALALDQVAVRGNVSSLSGRGGGLALAGSEVTISGSLIAENRNSGDGGGIWSGDSDVSIVNTTIANNVVDTSLYPSENWGAYGGAIEVGGGNWLMQNVTISGNSIADNNGGEDGSGSAIEGSPETGEFVNVIVYGNTGSKVDTTSQCTETVPSGGHNIEQQPVDEEPRCFDSPTDAIANPLLDPLANNGGETDTMALPAGSPAINTGLLSRCPAVDQRGLPRPQSGGCDIGAFEVQPAPPAVPISAPVLKPTIKRGKVKVKKAGKTFWVWPGFKLSCPAGTEPCTGTIKARAPRPKADGKASASAKKKVLVGKAKFSIAPGKTKALKLKLNSRGANWLRELGKLRTQFEVVARVGTGPPVKAKKTAKLKLPKSA